MCGFFPRRAWAAGNNTTKPAAFSCAVSFLFFFSSIPDELLRLTTANTTYSLSLPMHRQGEDKATECLSAFRRRDVLSPAAWRFPLESRRTTINGIFFL